jgi:quinoprotein glucose dehydrogenase
MIKVILFFLLFIIPLNNIDASEVKLQEIFKGLQSPWSLSFIDNENVILTEKSGNLLHINLIEKKIKKIKHNLDILEDGQGGLLDVLYKDQNIYVS